MRGKFMAAVASCWMFGSIYSASCGWAIIPTAGGWRAFVAVASLPAWLGVAAAAWSPESPRFLLVKGRHTEAVQVRPRPTVGGVGSGPSHRSSR